MNYFSILYFNYLISYLNYNNHHITIVFCTYFPSFRGVYFMMQLES
jgi:hypothetical protein